MSLPIYVRMVIPKKIDGFDARAGIFNAAYDLKYRPDVDQVSLNVLLDLLAWFEDHLDEPEKFSRTKNDWHKDFTRGISWFKPTADQYIQRLWALKSHLEEWGYNIDVLKTTRPGRIVYEDEFQIVADPFSDTVR